MAATKEQQMTNIRRTQSMTGGLPLSYDNSAEISMNFRRGRKDIVIVVAINAKGGSKRYTIMSYFIFYLFGLLYQQYSRRPSKLYQNTDFEKMNYFISFQTSYEDFAISFKFLCTFLWYQDLKYYQIIYLVLHLTRFIINNILVIIKDFLMNTYPLKDISRQKWQKKVNSTSMYTIPAEDEAYPILQELNQILTRLLQLPIEQTIEQSLKEYFLCNVFPTVCQKIIRSRYFKNTQVLKVSNLVLQKSVYLVPKYIDFAIKYPKFLEILTSVFSDEYYFKNNNQMTYLIYPYSYFPNNMYELPVELGEMIDVIKIGNLYEKVTWSRGKVTEVDEFELQVAYQYDAIDKKVRLKRQTPQIASYKSKSHTFQWRLGLKKGDLVDIQDSFGSWYNGTVLDVIERDQGKKDVKVTLKIYHQLGNKQDEVGPYFGFSQYQQTLDFTSAKIAPYGTVAKQYCYQSSKAAAAYDNVEDLNDYQFKEINGERVYALPRKKYLSQFQFQTINEFGKRGGFDKYMEYLEKQVNFDVLCYFVKGISGVTPYLHRQLVKNLVERLKDLFEKYLFSNSDKTVKTFTKQQSEMAFSGLKLLQKRIYSFDFVSKYENTLKMKLADICLQSEAIKNKLLGLNELKDIVRSVAYTTEKNKYIRQWVKNNKIFEKIYIVNSHVQLIKKSEQFFKYLCSESILEVQDLEKLYKMAQKGDFQSRISLYKLFQQVSHVFKRQHVQFLIDTILQSELNLILNQDIDLLHELSRFSNYFPLEKVVKFFQNIILGENKVKQLNDYAIKKYSQIVAKNTDMKPHRRNIIKNFLQKLSTHDVSQVSKVLKGIFDSISVGDWAKKDLNEILTEEKLDEVIVQTINKYKGHNDFNKVTTIMLDLLLFVYKLSQKAKIYIKTLNQIWTIIEGNDEKEKQFFKWANQVLKCEQGFQIINIEQLENFYKKIFSPEKIPEIQGSQFQLAKNLFVQINKKQRLITVTNTFKEREMQKEYKRKVQMNSLRLIDIIIMMIYCIKSETINNKVIQFFIQLYSSKDNTQAEIDEFLTKLLHDFKSQYESKNYRMLIQTIKLIQILINDSQKCVQAKINSLLSKKESEEAKFFIINETTYSSSESLKKSDMVLPMNTTIMKLRKILGMQFNLSWPQIKIVSHKQIEDYDNSRTLKQLKLSPNQPLTISKRSQSTSVDEQLILNDEMNPKAVRCFKVIFDQYSTNGRMNKQQCNNFTVVCLGSNCSAKYYNQKISSLYNRYDDDNDGLLTFENFVKFYEDAAKDRPVTVWSNLKSFGVKGDFRFNYEPDQVSDLTKYPRNIIAQYPNVYDILFDLLHVKEVASVAFELLQRLPVSKSIQQQLLNIGSSEDLQKILSTPDPYQLFYKLNIVQYLAHSSELQSQAQKSWHSKFIEFTGYELLYSCYEKLVFKQKSQKSENKQREEIEDIEREIMDTCLNLMNQYWVQCFSGHPDKVRLALEIVCMDQEIDDKMDFMLYGKFFKNDKKTVNVKPSKLPKQKTLFLWKGPQKSQIRSFLIKQLSANWQQLSDIPRTAQTQEKRYSLEMIITKYLQTLNILCMNEEPTQFVSIMSDLFEKVPSLDLVKSLYCVILGQCFYAKDNKYQEIYIRELFNNLTKRNITSEHFRVLAVLVSRFGIQSTSKKDQESTSKLKQVLLSNVLSNNNQLTVQGCAKLLINFNLQGTSYETFQRIWQQKLFDPSTFNQKQQSKISLYNLILKICDNNPQLTNSIIEKVLQTLNSQIKSMKIVYCNEFKQRSSTGYAGLKNLGSTCYINSMIQQLYINKNFRYCILRADDQEPPNYIEVVDNKNEVRTVDDNFLHQLQKIFGYLELTNRVDYVPKDFCVAYKPFGEPVNVLVQQDVQEFVSMFFDRLEAGLSKTIFKKLVTDFYLGKTVNLFKCHTCNKTKQVQQSFHSISLQVKTSKTLAQSFNRFCLGQMISDYKCQFCQNRVDVTKKTRISVAPKTLIIHLQRIVFNLDTFINQKITTKHSFPHDFNLYQSTLEYYNASEAGKEFMEPPSEYIYNLIGIICHSGTADSGHYISYIKTNDNKWIEFNDSQVMPFSASNIESECFGGFFASSSFDDDFYEEKKESSKSAYILIYEKNGDNTIQLWLNKQMENCKNQKERNKLKQQMLVELDLKEVKKKIKENQGKVQEQQKASGSENNDNFTATVTESHEQSSSAPQDSEKQTKKLLQQKQLEIKRHQSEDNIDPNPQQSTQQSTQKKDAVQQSQQKPEQKIQKSDTIIYIKDPVTAYIPEFLRSQITQDNNIHFFEKCLSSTSFVKFFSTLISKSNTVYKQILPICQKLTFGFWLKSTSFKDLLLMLENILKLYPEGFEELITNNPNTVSMLIESSDADIRTSMCNFLSRAIANALQAKGFKNYADNKADAIFGFLDKLFLLLPSTVSRCWTKFGQYFEFWYELSNKGEVLVEYMIEREIIKHFMDYFLDTKSPLKIYATKRQHQIGSSYANPNFSMLLKCVFSLLQQRMLLNKNAQNPQKRLSSSPDQQKLLMSFESLQKLISDNYQNIAAQLIKQICPHNLPASEKAAIVILKGISKSNTESIQPYLQVLHEYILIDDQYQDARIKWVIGKQTLAVSNLSLKILALNSYSLTERLYNYESSINIESGTSLLEPIITYHNRIQTFALLCTKELLKLCDVSDKIKKYVMALEAPTLTHSNFIHFLKSFIDKYQEQHKKSYGFYTSSVGFNREEFGKEVKQLFEKVNKKMQEQKQKMRVQQQMKRLSQQKQSQKQPSKKSQQQKASCSKKQENEQQSSQQQPQLGPKSKSQPVGNAPSHEPSQPSQTRQPPSSSQPSQKQSSDMQIIEESPKQKFIQFYEIENQGFDNYDEYPSLLDKKSLDKNYSYDNEEEDEGWEPVDIDQIHVIDKQRHQAKKRGNRAPAKGNEYNIVVEEAKEDSNKENATKKQDKKNQMTYTDSQPQEQGPKARQEARVEPQDYTPTYHPIKFEYTVVSTITPPQFSNIRIEEHNSPVIFLETKPTGTTNRSFANTASTHKNYEKLSQEIWNKQKVKNVNGFYVKNNGRDSVRMITDDGCAFVKGGENVFVWANQIKKIWVTQRLFEWPKWSMFS